MTSPRPTPEADDRYRGFSLASVGWGYRDLFRQIIEDLWERGVIGAHRQEVTATFFRHLQQADQGSYDHVLRRFLGAINPRTEWLLDLPAVFADVVDLGRQYAQEQPYRGVAYFTLLAEGGLGRTPEQVRQALTLARRLRSVDADLSLAFLQGYAHLSDRLDPPAVEAFVAAGLQAYAHQPRTGLAFLAGRLAGAETLIAALAQEARLQDLRGTLAATARALAGQRFEITGLRALGPDELAERGAQCVLLGDHLYLPERVRRAAARDANRAWYRLALAVAAGSWRFAGFSRLHGRGPYRTLGVLAGPAPLAANALVLAEWVRLLARCRDAWPGLVAGLRAELVRECETQGLGPGVRALLLPAAGPAPAVLDEFAAWARGGSHVLEVAAGLTPPRLQALAEACPELAVDLLPPLGFFPDGLFPAPPDSRPTGALLLDLRRAAGAEGQAEDLEQALAATTAIGLGAPDPEAGETAAATARATYVYDEWSLDAQAYLRGHCHVHETTAEPAPGVTVPGDLDDDVRRVRAAFERLRPESVRRERFLPDGDEIDPDRLVSFLTQRIREPSPRVDFYERLRVSRRDLATLILLDLSGSTAESAGGRERILALEQRAALVLGHGLATLGDRFAITGFHANGPRQCAFVLFKPFHAPWDRTAIARLLSAQPANSTRIGPALRHAGWQLSQIDCRQRLILLITDGRPMDTGYDPTTRYAHYDVRRACEENARQGIHTFGVSTEENSVADMEIMFPARRFVILPAVEHLPRLLPALYSRITL